eukprot:UN30628
MLHWDDGDTNEIVHHQKDLKPNTAERMKQLKNNPRNVESEQYHKILEKWLKSNGIINNIELSSDLTQVILEFSSYLTAGSILLKGIVTFCTEYETPKFNKTLGGNNQNWHTVAVLQLLPNGTINDDNR